MSRRKTTHVRIYQDTLNDIRSRFPNVSLADFIDVSIKTNWSIQAEAALRGKKYVKNKKK